LQEIVKSTNIDIFNLNFDSDRSFMLENVNIIILFYAIFQ